MSLDRRLLPIVASIIPIVFVVAGYHTVQHTTAWVTPFEWFVSGGLVTVAIASAIALWARAHRVAIALAAFLLAANTTFVVAWLLGVQLIPTQGFASDKYAVVLAAGTLLCIAGLIAQRAWARWIAIALGFAGIGCGVLNGINFWADSGTPYPADEVWFHQSCNLEWVNLVTATGGFALVTNLVAARARFTANPTWSSRERVVVWLRLALIAAFLAVPMLLVYAWMQPIVPATATTAVVLAAALAVAGTLAVRGKLIGAILLVAGGCGLAAQAIATTALAHEDYRRMTYYYDVFWAPAAILAIVCGVLMVRPMLRLLRAR